MQLEDPYWILIMNLKQNQTNPGEAAHTCNPSPKEIKNRRGPGTQWLIGLNGWPRFSEILGFKKETKNKNKMKTQE